MTGLHLSHYAIEAELGRGGMGIVYRAKDTKLNRTVALKVLPAGALASEDDRARFRREAQASAQLNHPNVCHVYEVDEAVPQSSEGKPVEGHMEPRLFIAMEYIDGETLHDNVKKGPLKLQEAVNIAGQVAEALKEAHAKDIVHRDIKSANIMLTEGGVAKVLDFGLAKTNQSTMLTRMGSTLGTVAYMSPEQARGQEVDGRSDLYSLGTVLYEMVAGRLPYTGDYEQAVLYGILNEAPEPLTAVRTGVPMQLEWVVDKLLKKEAEYRYQSAAGLLADLKSLDLSGSGRTQRSMPAVTGAISSAAPGGTSTLPRWIWPALAGLLVLGAAIGWLLKPTPETPRDVAVRSLTLEMDEFNQVGFASPSFDGKLLAVVGSDTLGRRGIYVRNLETGASSLVAEGNFGTPRFSRDASLLSIWRAGELFTVPVSGGTPVPIAENALRQVAWLGDNSLLYSSDGALWLYPADGSQPSLIAARDSVTFAEPSALPGDRSVLVRAIRSGESRDRLEIVELDTGDRQEIGFGTRPHYLPTGHVIYGDAESGVVGPLFARPFDLKSRRFTGPQRALYQNAPTWAYDFDGQGTLYHRIDQTSASDINDASVFRIDDDGNLDTSNPLYTGPSLESLRVSPVDDRIAVTVEAGDDYLLIFSPGTGVPQRITFSGDEDHHAWSSDPNRILLERDRKLEIWSTRGRGLLETLPVNDVAHLDWSFDGATVVFSRAGREGLWLFDLASGEESMFEQLPTVNPRFSPDGGYVAYEILTDQGQRVVVKAVDGSSLVRLSVNARESRRPVWSPDGRHIFLIAEWDVLRVPVSSAAGFSQAGPAEVVYSSTRGAINLELDIGRDGTMYLMTDTRISTGQLGVGPKFSVIVNWFEQVRRLAPPSG